MHEEDGRRPGEPPRRFFQSKERLKRARDETALAVQEQEGDHTDERRQHDRERDERAENPAARELRPLEEKGERNADGGGQSHGGERDPEARPESPPFLGPPREVGEVGERPPRRLECFGERDEERPADEPGEEECEEQRGEVRTPFHSTSPASRGYARGGGPPGTGATKTFQPGCAASGRASTSTSTPESSITAK